MLDPRLLRTFVAVVDTGSFTLAAARLHSTQSTVSQHLARLERASGQQLIDRAARPVAPTPAGERLLGYSRRLLTLHDEAMELMADPSGVSTIRIGVPDDLITPGMGRRVSAFARAHRQHLIDVSVGLSRDIARRYRTGELDIAVVKEFSPAPDARVSLPEPLAWFGDQALLDQNPIPLVSFPPGGLYRDLMIARMEREDRRWYIALAGDSLGSVVAAVEAGIGLSVLPVGAMCATVADRLASFASEPEISVSIYAWDRTGAVDVLAGAIEAELRASRSDSGS